MKKLYLSSYQYDTIQPNQGIIPEESSSEEIYAIRKACIKHPFHRKFILRKEGGYDEKKDKN